MRNKLLIIDGFNLLSRGYFATAYNRSIEQLTQTRTGTYTNALRVFFQKTFNIIEAENITHIAVAWDVKREETDRRKKYDFYKASRNELPEPLIQQYETLSNALSNMGISQFTIPPYEADDVIGSLAHTWSVKTEDDCLIYSNDKDLLQLLNAKTSQMIAQKNGEIVYTVNDFRTDYEIDPSQWIDVKALLGDSSDNISGVPGVGAKSALPLIKEYDSIENLYGRLPDIDPRFNRYIKKLIVGEELAKVSKELVTIECNIPYFSTCDLSDLKLSLDLDTVSAIMNELELRVNFQKVV